MSRASSCIKMLMALNARGIQSTAELAELLETNPRNIREYRNELEKAGFFIQETRGKHGGYKLMDQNILPSPVLTKQEKQALIDGRKYLSTLHDIINIDSYNSAIDKVLNTSRDQERHDTLFVPSFGTKLNKHIEEMLETCKQGIEYSLCVEITYRKKGAETAETYLIDPYEILHYDGSYYILAFSHKRNDYRSFRFSEERMLNCSLSETKFLKDTNFRAEHYIGKNSLVKADFVRITVEVKLAAVPIFKEYYWGVDFKEESMNADSIQYSFLVENMYTFYPKLFEMGTNIKLIRPENVVETYKNMIFSISQSF